MPVGDIAPEITVLLAAVAALLTASFIPQRLHWLCAPLALAGLATAAFLCLGQVGSSRLTFSGNWALDGAGTWARLLILAATAFTILMSPSWFRTDRRHGEYYALLLLSALGAMAMAAATDLLQLVIGVLLSSATGYTLAAYHRDWPLSVEAGMKYFLVGALANAMLAIGVTLLFGLLGNSAYSEMADALTTQSSSPLLLLGVGLATAGIAFKLAAVPAHAWMPDVAEGAPAPAAAFLTVVPKVGAAIALFRLISLFPADGFAVRPLVAVLAVATMTLGNLAALWQDDVRRLVGWSSVSQSGYALMAVCVVGLSPAAPPALLVFLFGYAAANLAVFAAIAHLRGRTARSGFSGLAARRPWSALALVLGFLSLVGIPPLAGFFGKFTLFVATINGGYAWLAAVAVGNTVISLFYYLRIVGPMYFGEPEGQVATLGRWTGLAVGLGILAVATFGFFAEPGINAFTGAELLP